MALCAHVALKAPPAGFSRAGHTHMLSVMFTRNPLGRGVARMCRAGEPSYMTGCVRFRPKTFARLRQ